MIWKNVFKKLSIILCLIPSIAQAEFRHFNDWSREEKAWFTAYQTFAWIDYGQTKHALEDPCACWYEQNPIYGKYPHPDKVLIGNLFSAAGVYLAIGAKPKNKRLKILQGITVYRAAVVYHNDSIGIDWRVAF